MPRNGQDRHLLDHHPGPRRSPPRRPLHRRTEARQPVPRLDDRLGLRDQREARRGHSQRPETGQVTFSVEDLPQVPFEAFKLHLFASDRGLMATPTHCTVYKIGSTFSPWNDRLAPQPSEPILGSTRAPAAAVPGRHPALQPEPGRGHLEPHGRRLLQLPPEARPRRRRPVPRRPQLHDAARLHRRPARHHLLPGGRDRRRRGQPRPRRAAAPELPGLEPDRDHERRRRSRDPPVPRGRARCTSPGPFDGGPLSLVAITPALAGPLRLRRRRRPRRARTSTRSTPR